MSKIEPFYVTAFFLYIHRQTNMNISWDLHMLQQCTLVSKLWTMPCTQGQSSLTLTAWPGLDTAASVLSHQSLSSSVSACLLGLTQVKVTLNSAIDPSIDHQSCVFAMSSLQPLHRAWYRLLLNMAVCEHGWSEAFWQSFRHQHSFNWLTILTKYGSCIRKMYDLAPGQSMRAIWKAVFGLNQPP